MDLVCVSTSLCPPTISPFSPSLFDWIYDECISQVKCTGYIFNQVLDCAATQCSAVDSLAELTISTQVEEWDRCIGRHRHMFIQRSSRQNLMINNSPETFLRWHVLKLL